MRSRELQSRTSAYVLVVTIGVASGVASAQRTRDVTAQVDTYLEQAKVETKAGRYKEAEAILNRAARSALRDWASMNKVVAVQAAVHAYKHDFEKAAEVIVRRLPEAAKHKDDPWECAFLCVEASSTKRVAKHARFCRDPEGDPDPALIALTASAVSGTEPAGPESRHRTVSLPRRTGFEVTSPLCVVHAGFSLHAATRVGGLDPEARLRLFEYLLRPPVANERLQILARGLVRVLQQNISRELGKTGGKLGTRVNFVNGKKVLEKKVKGHSHKIPRARARLS